MKLYTMVPYHCFSTLKVLDKFGKVRNFETQYQMEMAGTLARQSLRR